MTTTPPEELIKLIYEEVVRSPGQPDLLWIYVNNSFTNQVDEFVSLAEQSFKILVKKGLIYKNPWPTSLSIYSYFPSTVKHFWEMHCIQERLDKDA